MRLIPHITENLRPSPNRSHGGTLGGSSHEISSRYRRIATVLGLKGRYFTVNDPGGDLVIG